MADSAGQASQKAANTMSDAAITAKVQAALLAEPGLKSTPIHVDTKEATVTLTGNVDSATQRERVKRIALSTEGVKDVVDNLSVRPS